MPAAVPLADLFTPDDWFALLDVSLTSIQLLRPVYAPDGSAIVDFAIEYLNPAGQRMTGLAEQPGGTLLGRFPHALAEGIFQYYRRVFETGEQLTYETNYQADGLDNYFKFSARRSGERLLVSFTDTSDQDRSAVEDALRESQAAEQHARAEAERQRQRFHAVLMQLPAYVAVYHGPDHIYQFVNPPYQGMFPHRSFAGRPFREAMPESEALGVAALFNQVYQTGEPVYLPELEGWFDFHGTGQPEQVFINLSLHPLRNAQGRIDGVLDFSYNVTEQVRARRQVEQLNQELETRVQERTHQLSVQQALLRQILNHVPAYIATLSGPEHRYSFYNDAYEALSGGRITLGARAIDVFPEIVPQGFLALLDQVYTSGVAVTGTDVPAMLVSPATGQLEALHADFFYQPLVDEHQQVWGILAYVQDVSEKVGARQQVEQLNAQLTTSNTRLTRTNADLDTFVYTASHDLKAPITNIEGILNALRAILPAAVQQDDVVVHLLGLLHTTVSRFQTTIHQLTDLSRLQQTHSEPAELLLLAPVVADVLNDLAPAIAAADAQLHVAIPADLRVSFAPSSLRSVVYNLLSNAVKYRAPERTAQVWLTAERQPEAVVLAVRDNGLGLNEAQQTRLFGVFQRLHTHVEGTGVGLYMIKRLIENAGATNGELSDSNRQLTRSNVDLDTFVYTASHDLKAPITNIESIVLALRDTLPAAVQQDELVAHLLDLLNQTVTRFRFTIGQLTDISKLQLAHAGPAEPVLLVQALENVRLDLAPAIAAADTRLTVEVPDDLVVLFSPANLRSIVYNLLSNAIKYRAPGRPAQVHIHAESTESGVVLTVQDNGMGMSEVQQRQLFGLFQRLHTHVEGTGVGLYITKRLIENAGGTIAVQSQPDAGTTFTVTLPA